LVNQIVNLRDLIARFELQPAEAPQRSRATPCRADQKPQSALLIGFKPPLEELLLIAQARPDPIPGFEVLRQGYAASAQLAIETVQALYENASGSSGFQLLSVPRTTFCRARRNAPIGIIEGCDGRQ
jgi:hypothetical protein